MALSAALVFACALSSGFAFADDAAAQSFVEHEHQKLATMLHEPKTAARDDKIAKALDAMVDYDELTRRAFGHPCAKALPGCVDYYSQLSAEQQATLKDLLRQNVDRNYRKNLEKTLDYDVTYKGTKDDSDGHTRVRTEAKSKSKPRDPAVQVDYVVRDENGKFWVVDIVTEGSSLTKNDYVQFDKKFKAHPGDLKAGYEEIVAKLKEKLQKP
jgi:phospholipid transport system substrate-binding protein